jgi:hypothetical protein
MVVCTTMEALPVHVQGQGMDISKLRQSPSLPSSPEQRQSLSRFGFAVVAVPSNN